MLIDYHIHSEFSPDSSARISDIAAAAVLEGLSEVAITDHLDLHPGGVFNWGGNTDFEGFFSELEKVREIYEGELVIRAGIEIGNAFFDPDKADGVINNYPFDYVLASVHDPTDIELFTMDFTKCDLQEVKKVYLSEMAKVVDWGNFDCLAHFDLPVRYAALAGIDLDFGDFSEKIEGMLTRLLEYGNKGLELNLSGYMNKTQKPLPSRNILEMWQRMGGRIVTIGTDSHGCKTVGKFAQEGQELLLSCGFTQFATFEKREPILNEIEWKEWE